MIRLYHHLRQHIFSHRFLWLLSLMLFFWCLYESIVSYITPIIIENKGISSVSLGIIISFSSLSGALLDFILSRFLKNTHFLRLFFWMLSITLFYPLLLSKVS